MRKEDWRSIGFSLATIFLLFWGYTNDWQSLLSLALYMAVASFACFICSVINHNHVHHPTFKARTGNSAFEVLLTMTRGHTSATVWLPHNRNHHHLNGANGDWITPNHVNHGQSLMSTILYVCRSMVTMRRMRKKEEHLVPHKIQSKQKWQRNFLYLFIAIILIMDPFSAVVAFGIPWFFGAALLVGVNLYQHANCEPGDDWSGSRNFIGKFENWIFFNNGLHTAHHIYPSKHWSELRKVHDQIESKIPEHLIHTSIIGYSLRKIFGLASEPDFQKTSQKT